MASLAASLQLVKGHQRLALQYPASAYSAIHVEIKAEPGLHSVSQVARLGYLSFQTTSKLTFI